MLSVRAFGFFPLVTSAMVVIDPSNDFTYFTWSNICHPNPVHHPYSLYRLVVCITVVVLVYCIPFILITVTYVKIFTAAKGNSVCTRRNSVSSIRYNSASSIYGRNLLTIESQSRKASSVIGNSDQFSLAHLNMDISL